MGTLCTHSEGAGVDNLARDFTKEYKYFTKDLDV